MTDRNISWDKMMLFLPSWPASTNGSVNLVMSNDRELSELFLSDSEQFVLPPFILFSRVPTHVVCWISGRFAGAGAFWTAAEKQERNFSLSAAESSISHPPFIASFTWFGERYRFFVVTLTSMSLLSVCSFWSTWRLLVPFLNMSHMSLSQVRASHQINLSSFFVMYSHLSYGWPSPM